MIFANLRIRFLNWLSAPAKTVFQNAYKKEQTNMSYSINTGPGLGGVGSPWSNGGTITLGPHTTDRIDIAGRSTVNLTVANANGGWIVQINNRDSEQSLYVIPEGADFDRELGKIITMSCLKG